MLTPIRLSVTRVDQSCNFHHRLSSPIPLVFTARCYAERGYATRSCPSVYLCLSVTFRYRDHTGWNSWENDRIAEGLCSGGLNMGHLVQREHP